jgi:hypothetical protein
VLLTEVSQEKLKKIRESGKFCCIQIFSDFMYVWDISLIPYHRSDTDKHEVKWRSGSYEDLNDAVESIYQQIEGLIEK